MNIDDVMNDWDKEGGMDIDNPAEEAIRNHTLHSKYLRILKEARTLHNRFDIEYKRLYSEKFNYYISGPSSTADAMKRANDWKQLPVRGQKYIKQDLPMTLDADADVIAARRLRDGAQIAVGALEDIVKHINNRGFAISAIIQWRMYEAGK